VCRIIAVYYSIFRTAILEASASAAFSYLTQTKLCQKQGSFVSTSAQKRLFTADNGKDVLSDTTAHNNC